MSVVEWTPWSHLAVHAFGRWMFISGQASQSPSLNLMAATCIGGVHQIWLVNERADRAWPVASPHTVGYLVTEWSFADHIERDQRYAPLWKRWVRAMFVPRALAHLPRCDSIVQKEEEEAMSCVSTLGTFTHDGEVYAVEWHPSEIRVTDAQGRDAAVMPFKTGRVLAVAAPGASAAPAELLDLLRERAIEVLEAEAAERRGPWAFLEQAQVGLQ